MLIGLHKNARTTPAVRAEVAASDETASVLAQCFGITEQTVYKWKKRSVFCDRSHTAHRLQTVCEGVPRATTMRDATLTSGAAESVIASLARASSAMIDSGATAGWLSALTLGWRPSASCVLASSVVSTFMSRCFLWPVASSVFGLLPRFVSRS